MTRAADLLIIAASVFGLWWGAVWLVESAARIAKRLGLSELGIDNVTFTRSSGA